MRCPYKLKQPFTAEQEQSIQLTRLGLRDLTGFAGPKTRAGADLRFYVYALLNETGKPHYIGKGQGDRLLAHERAATQIEKRTRKHKWIRDVWKKGERVLRCIVGEGLTSDDAFALELRLTERIGLENLLNEQHGGKDPFLGITPERRAYIMRARAMMQARSEMSEARKKVGTNYVQEACAAHPKQTAEETKAYLIARGEPWSSGRVDTKNPISMLQAIRTAADELFASLGINTDHKVAPARIFLQKTSIAHPDWTVPQCILYARENGPDPSHKANDVVVSDCRGVLRKYAVLKIKAELLKPFDPIMEEPEPTAPKASVDQEGVSSQEATAALSSNTFGHNGGPSWNKDELAA